MKEKLVFVLILTFMISLASLTSAQTLITGKVYSDGSSNIVSGALVTVACYDYILSTSTLEDGTYAIKFDLCSLGESVKVSATKGNFYGEDTGTVIECDGTNCADSEYLAVLNLMIKTQSKIIVQHSSGGKYYFCGNGKCDSGENERTCPKDCKKETIVNDIQELGFNTNIQDETNQNLETINQEDKGTFSSGITEAVASFSKNKTGISLALLIIVFAVILIFILAKKKN